MRRNGAAPRHDEEDLMSQRASRLNGRWLMESVGKRSDRGAGRPSHDVVADKRSGRKTGSDLLSMVGGGLAVTASHRSKRSRLDRSV